MALTEVPIELSSTPGIIDNSTGTAITIDSSQNVGIGQSNPTSPNGATDFIHIGNATNQDTSIVLQDAVETWEIYQNDDLSFLFDTTNVMTLQRLTGNVGIGTSSPTAVLHAKNIIDTNAASGTGVFKLQGGVSTYSGYIGFDASTMSIGTNNASRGLSFAAGGSERMRISSDGDVGIGTDSPAAAKFSSTPDGVLNLSGDKPVVYLTEEDETDSNVWMGLSNEVGIIGNTGVGLAFRTGASTATERMRIDSSGRLLINKTSSTGSLSLESQAPSGFSVGSGFYSGVTQSTIEFQDTNTTANYKVRIGSETDDLLMFAGGSERMRIDSGGSVLIGKSTPTDLHNTWNHLIIGEKGAIISENGAGGIDGITLADNVYIDADTGTYAYQTTAAASQITQSGGVIAFSNAASGSAGAALTPVERMRLDASGNLIVGNTVVPSASEAGAAFDPNTNGRAILKLGTSSTANQGLAEFFNPNGQVGGITTNGSATAYNTSSDQRLKENIVDAPSASDDIDAIQVRSFDWKADGSHQKYGMVAQELQTVAPEAVSVPEDPEEMMGVDYSKLVPMMLKEIQSLRARVAQLES